MVGQTLIRTSCRTAALADKLSRLAFQLLFQLVALLLCFLHTLLSGFDLRNRALCDFTIVSVYAKRHRGTPAAPVSDMAKRFVSGSSPYPAQARREMAVKCGVLYGSSTT